jgi:hypothetical protein
LVLDAIAAAHTRDACQEFNNQRWVALLLRDIARLLPHSEQSEQYSALVSAGRAAEADLLSRSPAQYLHSSYVRCYGDGSGSEHTKKRGGSLHPLPFHELEDRPQVCGVSCAQQDGRARLVDQHELASVVTTLAAARPVHAIAQL